MSGTPWSRLADAAEARGIISVRGLVAHAHARVLEIADAPIGEIEDALRRAILANRTAFAAVRMALTTWNRQNPGLTVTLDELIEEAGQTAGGRG